MIFLDTPSPLFKFPLSSLISQILCFVFNWRIIALQCCGSLCHTSRQISHNHLCICISSLPTLSPHPSPLGHHRVPAPAPCVMQQLPVSALSYTWWCVCVKATFLTHLTLSFQHCLPVHSLPLCDFQNSKQHLRWLSASTQYTINPGWRLRQKIAVK